MTERRHAIAAFLQAQGWHPDQLEPLADDASFRSYWRLGNGNRHAVLMDAPPANEDVRPFLAIARHLEGLGFSAPKILEAQPEAGLVLLEDLGDDTYSRLLDRGAEEAPLYRLAVEVLVHLHDLPAERALPPDLPPYDDRRLLDEALLLTDWYMPAVLPAAPSESVRRGYVDAWIECLRALHDQPRTLVLRDFHVDNLMRLSDRTGISACGLLDFQDAVAGPAAYDLMSLLEDARRDIGADLKASMLAHYHDARAIDDRGAFDIAFAVLAAQRHAKVIGIFTRLCLRDGKPAYLVHIPRVWRLLEDALRAPALAPVAAWFERHLPADARGIPPCPPLAP